MEAPWNELDETTWSAHLASSRWYDYQHLAGYELAAAERKGGRSIFLRHHTSGCGAAVRLTNLAGGLVKVAYAPAGLSFKEPVGNPELLVEVLQTLASHLLEAHGAVLVMRVPALQMHRCQAQEAAALRAGLVRVGRSRQRWTIVLPIDRTDDALMANFNTKWRYALKQGLKQELEVDRDHQPESCDRLKALLDALMERKRFDVVFDAGFYRERTDLFESEQLALFGARRPGESDWCSAILVSRQGDAGTYLLGASTPEGLKAQAPSVLQWNAIQWLRERGCDAYDLGGVDWTDNPHVYTFKKRMNGAAAASSPMMVYTKPWMRSRLCRLAFELKG